MTMSQEMARIEVVEPREIWSNEARDFTPWLAKHISELGEALGLDLELQSAEAPVGGFSLDILAREVGRDRPVIVENQLGPTDHSHLGQLLTYAAGYDANVVVWIAKEFRDEHREALDLLNRHTDDEIDFFGVAIEVWKIKDSPPAPHFRVVSAPNDWRKQTKKSTIKGQLIESERGERYRDFFQALVEVLREQHRFTNSRKGGTQSWRAFPAGYGWRVHYGVNFGAGEARVEVYIDSQNKDWNESLFDTLEDRKESIEVETGELKWERLDNKRACKIKTVRPGSINSGESELAEIQNWMVENLLLFKKTFGPLLEELVQPDST